jgi:alpha-galactosidase/6-phospho-beta-glucosidase family protein
VKRIDKAEKMDINKIAIIGGGSPYIPAVLYSFAHFGEVFSETEICLMDIDPSRLPLMQALGTKIAEEAKSKLKITATTNLRESLDGSTFVISNFRAGGIESLRLDEEIPVKYGIYGNETTGPGGTFYALRSIPQTLNLCRSIEINCPDAWLINYTNPTNFVADAIRRKSKIKCIAVCDGGGNGLSHELAESFKKRKEEVRLRCAGTNHPANWIIDIRVNGENGYPLLEQHIIDEIEKAEKPEIKREFEFDAEIMKTYGFYPANSVYLFPYFHHDEALAFYRNGCWSLYRTFMKELPTQWKKYEAIAKGESLVPMDGSMHHTGVTHGDLATQIITAIVTNKQIELHLNIPNEGAIPNLPHSSIVEVPALIDASGIKPLCMGKLPKGLQELASAIIHWEELTVDVALSGDRELLLQALMAHPRWPVTFDKAEKICSEMLKAHSKYLPQFDNKNS